MTPPGDDALARLTAARREPKAVRDLRQKLDRCETAGFVHDDFDVADLRETLDYIDRLRAALPSTDDVPPPAMTAAPPASRTVT